MEPSFLERLLDAQGPSGFEVRPARVWRAEAEAFADRVLVAGGAVGDQVAEGDELQVRQQLTRTRVLDRVDDPREPEVPELPDVPDEPEVPELPDVPEEPDVPSEPDVPEVPELPDVPLVPVVPD